VIFDHDAAAHGGHVTRYLTANANRAGNASEFAGLIVGDRMAGGVPWFLKRS